MANTICNKESHLPYKIQIKLTSKLSEFYITLMYNKKILIFNPKISFSVAGLQSLIEFDAVQRP